MLNQDTKRKIDSARDILVGKVPDPKAQVEQITTALIYKFMDDLDKESEELGGKPRFFVNEFEKYAWTKLFDTRLGGFERLNLYVEALLKMPQNKYIPQLFRDILKDAFLPYRDPETLTLFLKEINEFTYDHSEKLGDAYEYLLSVLGSQGDAGQFRTPRHIIDFIVEVIDPKKDETVLDPACGTAGFLISGYKHILRQNTKERSGDQLTPDEKKRLMSHFMGYDISPDMVRLSLTNMYLHSFPSPNIYEYDTLTSEERWDETYDVIMANPPFMSPKGGIRPHKRFTTQATRSEVLFVDYIAEHLNVNGRAGVIVPEGIIFQSGGAYKSLRKMLVENNYLYAVVSLPAGIFQPYSGVKTSILLMDKSLAKKADSILFIKVNNDGFDLGAQRRIIEKNDLVQALDILQRYKQVLQKNEKSPNLYDLEENIKLASLVDKTKISENGNYTLSGERYKEDNKNLIQKWSLVELETICDVRDGTHDSPQYQQQGYPLITSKNVHGDTIDFSSVNLISEEDLEKINKRSKVDDGDIIMPMIGTIGNPIIVKKDREFAIKNLALIKFKENSLVDNYFLKYILDSDVFNEHYKNSSDGSTQKFISLGFIRSLKIPLPPLPMQKEIVLELNSYQKIIDGAKQVVENYKPSIKIDPSWEMIKLGQIFTLKSGATPSTTDRSYYENGDISWVKTKDLNNSFIFETEQKITQVALRETHCEIFPVNTNLIAMYGGFNQIGRTGILKIQAATNQALTALLPNPNANPIYINLMLNMYRDRWKAVANSTRKDPNITKQDISNFIIPLPSLEIQMQVVEKIEEEKILVDANKRLIEIFEQKIKDKISEVWGEDTASSTDNDIATPVLVG